MILACGQRSAGAYIELDRIMDFVGLAVRLRATAGGDCRGRTKANAATPWERSSCIRCTESNGGRVSVSLGFGFEDRSVPSSDLTYAGSGSCAPVLRFFLRWG